MNTSYIDTHCHLNFKRFNKTREAVVSESVKKGVGAFIVPGTDIFSSQKAVDLSNQFDGVYAAVGIHPHHTFDSSKSQVESQKQLTDIMEELEKLIIYSKVVAVGEIGLDSHQYEETKYEEYTISPEFIDAQKEYLRAQIRLAQKHDKAMIFHNREAKAEFLSLINEEWDEKMRYRAVFHCCEPDGELLSYALNHNTYIGIDGDVTYGGEKAEFAKKIPLELLVLETDSPFLLPEPLKTQKLYPNTPENIPLIAEHIAKLKGITVEEVGRVTTENARKLFRI